MRKAAEGTNVAFVDKTVFVSEAGGADEVCFVSGAGGGEDEWKEEMSTWTEPSEEHKERNRGGE